MAMTMTKTVTTVETLETTVELVSALSRRLSGIFEELKGNRRDMQLRFASQGGVVRGMSATLFLDPGRAALQLDFRQVPGHEGAFCVYTHKGDVVRPPDVDSAISAFVAATHDLLKHHPEEAS